MADIAIPSIATATPVAADTVLGVQSGAVKRFSVANLRKVLIVPESAANDFAALRAFFNAAPEGAVIRLVPGTTYNAHGGAIVLKPNQALIGTGAVIRRADEVKTTTSANLAYGATSTVAVVSTAGFVVGQRVGVYGTISGGATAICRDAYISAIGASDLTLTIGAQFVNLATGAVTSSDIVSGATVMTRGPLIDSYSLVDGTAPTLISDIVIDGNVAGNAAMNRWEYCSEIKAKTKGGLIENVSLSNSCGEGIVVYGTAPRINGVFAESLNGNGIHFNHGCYDPIVENVYIDGCCLTDIGHSDGAIIASNETYRAIVRGFSLKNSRKAGFASWDQVDNAFAKISDGFIENCWGGGLRLLSSSITPGNVSEGVHVENVDVVDSSVSLFGAARNSLSLLGEAKNWRIKGVRFYDCMAYFTGLVDSEISVAAHHSDSSVATATTTAAAWANNYTGPYYGAVGGIVSITACERSRFTVDASDGGAVSGKAVIHMPVAAGGPNADNHYELRVRGGDSGMLIDGVFMRCRGFLKAHSWSGQDAIHLRMKARSVDAGYTAGRNISFDNDFTVDVFHAETTADSRRGVRVYGGSSSIGWLTLRGKIRIAAATVPTAYGVYLESITYKVQLRDLEIIGPASNFVPWRLVAANAAGEGRVSGVRTYPAAAVLPTNWVADVATVTLPA